MTGRSSVKSLLLAALVSIALGGFLLHTRIHPVARNAANLVPAISGVLGVLVIPALFCSRRTIAWGYVLNGFSAIIGTIMMAHYSIARWPSPATAQAILLNTTLGDIMVLWGKFFVGKALFDLEFFGYDAKLERKGRPLRYPNMGWWAVHFAGASVVYWLGHIIWR
jgi:hypothetical protein